MKTLYRPEGARMHRADTWKTSAYAFVPYETHFGELCGFADDVVAPGRGFGMHSHRDMEITTLMREGAQRHADTTGGAHVLGPHAVQTLSAGTGLSHSEMNDSEHAPFHSYQVWVYPRHKGTAPRYDTFSYRPEQKQNQFLLALSPDRREGSALIGQDAFFSVAAFEAGKRGRYALRAPGNGVYVHCARGEVLVSGLRLREGDAAGFWETGGVDVEAAALAELVLVEVPMARGVRV
ncbi:MAG TPA: pirin family protein [Archangium sp.]|uniref:pirin family protein n=1 Tax=Archangium sp. TaxID=1872627 RepID=UPI002E311FE6|nr:pirin family protein [Archangium sp.]HEX5752985.1 pirin family protein [Archangium sp.]